MNGMLLYSVIQGLMVTMLVLFFNMNNYPVKHMIFVGVCMGILYTVSRIKYLALGMMLATHSIKLRKKIKGFIKD